MWNKGFKKRRVSDNESFLNYKRFKAKNWENHLGGISLFRSSSWRKANLSRRDKVRNSRILRINVFFSGGENNRFTPPTPSPPPPPPKENPPIVGREQCDSAWISANNTWCWNFKELLHNNPRFTWGWDEVLPMDHIGQVFKWAAWPELFSMSLFCVCIEGRGLRSASGGRTSGYLKTRTQNDKKSFLEEDGIVG